jgi:DNA polymerase
MTPMNKPQMLSMLDEQVVQCTKCSDLVSNRSRTVFGVGNPDAKVMFIGEAPGQKEDEKGEPFVGPAGQLLTNIITACGWKREDVYIAANKNKKPRFANIK